MTTNKAGLLERNKLIWRSLRSLPLWVQIWVVGILVPVNAAAFLMLDTPTGHWTAIAAVFVMATNMPIMYYYCGMNRAMSVPHLIAWGPLQVYLIMRLATGEVAAGSAELIYLWLLLVVNGISLVFDLLDSYKWLVGGRETPGIDEGASHV